MTDCPCGSGQTLVDCCAALIDQGRKAVTAEQLMRARYTAHTQANIGFILRSHHPATRSDIDEASTARWAKESEWLGLEIRDVDGGNETDKDARVEFVARYRDGSGKRHDHAEMPKVSQFTREAPKQGRNEPCACGSGKKFKKCCGAAA